MSGVAISYIQIMLLFKLMLICVYELTLFVICKNNLLFAASLTRSQTNCGIYISVSDWKYACSWFAIFGVCCVVTVIVGLSFIVSGSFLFMTAGGSIQLPSPSNNIGVSISMFWCNLFILFMLWVTCNSVSLSDSTKKKLVNFQLIVTSVDVFVLW